MSWTEKRVLNQQSRCTLAAGQKELLKVRLMYQHLIRDRSDMIRRRLRVADISHGRKGTPAAAAASRVAQLEEGQTFITTLIIGAEP